MHRVPREAGAFDARRKLAHAREDFQATQLVRRLLFVQLAEHHAMKFIEQGLDFRVRLALYALRHHARRRFRDRAARSFKAHVLDHIVFDEQIHSQLIAAEWIDALGRAVRRFKALEVARLLVVVEDDLLVKFAQFRHVS